MNFNPTENIPLNGSQHEDRKTDSCQDESVRLRVSASGGAGASNEERVYALVAAGVDVLRIDPSHGYSEVVLQRIREPRATDPDPQIIVRNLATHAVALELA